MDDLFQYLIYGILIFSFLSSFFKKKEPPKQTPQKPAQRPESISYQQRSTKVEPEIITQKNDEYDILRELESLFKGEVNLPKHCLLYTSPSPRDGLLSRMPSSA